MAPPYEYPFTEPLLMGKTPVRFLILVPVIILICLAFSNILTNDFVWDDRYFLLNWPQIKSPLDHLPSILKGEMPLGQGAVYRPIRSLWYAISYNFGGESPKYYHLQSIVLHLCATILVFQITFKITRNKWVGLLSSLIFGLHPFQVQSVTWITGSFVESVNISLLSLFAFLSLC